ncbi:site-specific integrase [Chryseobacterium joostei]|uniref:Site-specific integrase n=1 Tax=Chryseobacterium joostei TaxID=112234 RepID=A0A1N7KNW2_9FLAO|nr:site-specific integrase [Chryseobacterium joostei]AZB01816.1 site-specific integrase [Chryseobacterium joostei]SIS63247.1 Site-specific recombinase XerD [Chryseobacterium joostei]
MNKTFNLLFYVKKTKTNKAGEVTIYLRITIDGKRTEISTKRTIKSSKWNSDSQKVAGSSEESKTLNFFLKTFEQKIYNTYHSLMKDDEGVTCETLKNRLLGKDEFKRTLIPIFNDHNDRMEKLVGKEFALGTLGRYRTCLSHIKEFLNWKLEVSDIDVTKINYTFLNDFEFFLRTEKSCNNNSAVKYIKNFGKIIRSCLANGWMEKDPFLNYHSNFDEVKRVFLNEQELEKLFNKDFKNERLSQVRYIFLFSCYTGLAYIDTQKLTKNHINIGLDGNKWIYTVRQKTKTTSNIPVLPQAEDIIRRYINHPICINTGKLLPVLSNQKMNAYLKEIADLCGINKELTYHIARHTFATTVTLSNGVPIESVSKMLGHKNIKTTQHYAKILDKKVSEDMVALKSVLEEKELQRKLA